MDEPIIDKPAVDKPITFSDLMPKEQGTMKSLRELLTEERIRLNRSPEDIKSFEKMTKRGGYGGQFTEDNR